MTHYLTGYKPTFFQLTLPTAANDQFDTRFNETPPPGFLHGLLTDGSPNAQPAEVTSGAGDAAHSVHAANGWECRGPVGGKGVATASLHGSEGLDFFHKQAFAETYALAESVNLTVSQDGTVCHPPINFAGWAFALACGALGWAVLVEVL